MTNSIQLNTSESYQRLIKVSVGALMITTLFFAIIGICHIANVTVLGDTLNYISIGLGASYAIFGIAYILFGLKKPRNIPSASPSSAASTAVLQNQATSASTSSVTTASALQNQKTSESTQPPSSTLIQKLKDDLVQQGVTPENIAIMEKVLKSITTPERNRSPLTNMFVQAGKALMNRVTTPATATSTSTGP